MQTPKIRLSLTRNIPKPSYYIQAIDTEFKDYAYNEERAITFRGSWREKSFGREAPLDLEIGTGNGYHFAHYAESYPERNLVGIEIKYKPLIQSIRRALRAGSQNARILRYDAQFLEDLFDPEELNRVLIHFPDPWEKRRQKKNRLVNLEFLKRLHRLQQPKNFVDFKTDSRDYFESVLAILSDSPYKVVGHSFDLHKSEWAQENFVTQFEQIFLKQNLPIHFVRLEKQ